MKNPRGKPICGATIEGPKIDARGNVAWRSHCRRIVKTEGRLCWQHDPDWVWTPSHLDKTGTES